MHGRPKGLLCMSGWCHVSKSATRHRLLRQQNFKFRTHKRSWLTSFTKNTTGADFASLGWSSEPLLSVSDPKSSRSSNPEDPGEWSKNGKVGPKTEQFLRKIPLESVFCLSKTSCDPKMVRFVPKTELFLSQTPLEYVFCRSRTTNFRRSSSWSKNGQNGAVFWTKSL